jgi:hypothetical protein
VCGSGVVDHCRDRRATPFGLIANGGHRLRNTLRTSLTHQSGHSRLLLLVSGPSAGGPVGCPIVVAGYLWGVIAASTKSEDPFPADT